MPSGNGEGWDTYQGELAGVSCTRPVYGVGRAMSRGRWAVEGWTFSSGAAMMGRVEESDAGGTGTYDFVILGETTAIVEVKGGSRFPQHVLARKHLPRKADLELSIEVVDGQPVVTLLSLSCPSGVSPSLAQGLPLERIFHSTIASIAGATTAAWNRRMEGRPGAPSQRPSNVGSILRLRPEDETTRVGTMGARRGRSVADEDLQKAAAIARTNDYDPRQEIARRLNVSPRTATRYIAEARKRGLLQAQMGR